MRLTRLLPVLLSLWSAVWAADPFIGKWTLNVDKSDFGDGPKAKSGRTTFKAQINQHLNGSLRDGYMYESETDFGKGSTMRLGAPQTFDGTAYPGVLDGHGIIFVSKKIDGATYKVLIADRKSNKVTQVFQYHVSADNTTLTFSWWKIGQEKPFLQLVYDKE